MKEKLDIYKIIPIIKKEGYKVNEKFYDILKMYKTGEYIYIDAIARYTKLNKQTIVEVLELLCCNKILERYYSINCNNCGHSIGHFFTSEELDEEFFCDNCDSIIDMKIKPYQIVYKVI